MCFDLIDFLFGLLISLKARSKFDRVAMNSLNIPSQLALGLRSKSAVVGGQHRVYGDTTFAIQLVSAEDAVENLVIANRHLFGGGLEHENLGVRPFNHRDVFFVLGGRLLVSGLLLVNSWQVRRIYSNGAFVSNTYLNKNLHQNHLTH